MHTPRRTLPLLAVAAMVAFLVLGNTVAQRTARRASASDLREVTVHVTLADRSLLSVQTVAPVGEGPYPAALLAGVPASRERMEFGRALARRGWVVAIPDLWGTGASRGTTVVNRPAGYDAERAVADLTDLRDWLGGIFGVNGTVVVLGTRAGAPAALAAKGRDDGFAAAALLFPIFAPESSRVSAPAYRVTPSGVMVVRTASAPLPAVINGALQEPTREYVTTDPGLADAAADRALMDALDRFLRNPGGADA